METLTCSRSHLCWHGLPALVNVAVPDQGSALQGGAGGSGCDPYHAVMAMRSVSVACPDAAFAPTPQVDSKKELAHLAVTGTSCWHGRASRQYCVL